MFSSKMVKLLNIIIIFVLYNILLLQFQSNLIGSLGINHYNLIVYGAYFIVGLVSSYWCIGVIYLFLILAICIGFMTIFITGLHSYSVVYALISILLGLVGYWVLFLGRKLKRCFEQISRQSFPMWIHQSCLILKELIQA